MKSKNKNKGTALLVTVLLVAAIGAIAFGIFKISNSELSVGTKDEEGIEAFYAAEAGVEDALMRFKFIDGGDLEIPEKAREKTSDVLRIDLNKGSLGIKDYNNKNDNPESNKYIYDLKVWYKTDEFTTTLEKDQSVILDVSDFAKTGSLFVNWEPEGQNTKLWYRLYDPDSKANDPRQLGRDFFTYLAYPDENQNPARNDPNLKNIYLWSNRDVDFNTFGFNTLKFKAFDGRIKLKVWTTNRNLAIGGPNLYIESTGYYGNTDRKLKVTVDRASKSILDIFDYVIYSDKNPLP